MKKRNLFALILVLLVLLNVCASADFDEQYTASFAKNISGFSQTISNDTKRKEAIALMLADVLPSSTEIELVELCSIIKGAGKTGNIAISLQGEFLVLSFYDGLQLAFILYMSGSSMITLTTVSGEIPSIETLMKYQLNNGTISKYEMIEKEEVLSGMQKLYNKKNDSNTGYALRLIKICFPDL